MLCSGSNAKFRQHLLAVLLIHVSAINKEDVHPENNREALTKFRIGSRAQHTGKRTQSTHTRAVHGYCWTIRKDGGYKYAKTCIFIDVALSNGRRILVTHTHD